MAGNTWAHDAPHFVWTQEGRLELVYLKVSKLKERAEQNPFTEI